MRHAAISLILALLIQAAGLALRAEARDRPLEELPRDVWELAFVWTEPIKSVAKEMRRFDPLSGLWFGLLEGSVKSVERTAEFFIPRNAQEPPTSPDEADNPLLRYSF